MATIVAGDMYEKLDGQLFEIKRQIRQPSGYPYNPEQLSRYLQEAIEGRFKNEVTLTTLPTSRDNRVIMKWLNRWPVFCKEFGLKMELDFRALRNDPRILNRREGFDWFVYKPTGFTARNAIEILEKLKSDFTVFEEIPVEGYTSKEFRPPKPHLVLCRADVEPDKEWRISANSMRATAVPFLDHTERYLLEAFHYWLYRKSLDIIGWTRCPRSRASSGRVAYANRNGSEFKAYWLNGDYDDSRGGGREVVIL